MTFCPYTVMEPDMAITTEISRHKVMTISGINDATQAVNNINIIVMICQKLIYFKAITIEDYRHIRKSIHGSIQNQLLIGIVTRCMYC